jgi:transposase
MKKTLRQFTPQQKATLRGHLAMRVPVSDLCDEHRLHPTLLCQWEKAFVEKRAAAFEVGANESGHSGARPIRDGCHPPIEANGAGRGVRIRGRALQR